MSALRGERTTVRSALSAVHAAKALFCAKALLRCFTLSDLSKVFARALIPLPGAPIWASALSTHASFRRHLCTFMQAGQRSGISRFVSNESSTIVSVLSPVETAVPRIGQRIMILGKK
jgi:hypothetical protein